MHSNTIHGLIAQNKAELRAIEKGYIVSKPIHECVRYDMLVDDGKSIKRLQVKYAGGKQSSSTGSCKVDFRKKSINGTRRNYYTKEEIDGAVVYIPELDEVCYFPIEVIENKPTLTIRYVDSTKSNRMKDVTFAKDYIW